MPWSDLGRRVQDYLYLMRTDRPIGTLLLLWPTLWALWVASSGRPDPWILTVFLVGVFLMRSAGCVINDFADRHYDPQVARTRERPLASGRVAPVEALMLFSLLALLAFVLVLTLKPLAIFWSLPAIAISVVYPFMKRLTHLPQLVLGIAFSMGVPMAFAAQNGSVPPVAWLIVAANLSWVVAYDTMYAMVDRDDDMRAGIKSSAILFGRYDRLVIGVLQALAMLLLAVLGWNLRLDAYYYGALTLAAGLGVYQQLLLHDGKQTACFRAFLNNAWFGAIIFLGLALAYL